MINIDKFISIFYPVFFLMLSSIHIYYTYLIYYNYLLLSKLKIFELDFFAKQYFRQIRFLTMQFPARILDFLRPVQ